MRIAKVHLKRLVELNHFLDEMVRAALGACQEWCEPAGAAVESNEQKAQLRRRSREILRVDMEVAEECELSIFCQETSMHEPWSEDAVRALQEDDEALTG